MNKKHTLILLCLLFMGCTPMAYYSVNPSWNPEQGQVWADAQCQATSQGASGYDWIDAASNRSKSYSSCMKAYGYELQRVPQKND